MDWWNFCYAEAGIEEYARIMLGNALLANALYTAIDFILCLTIFSGNTSVAFAKFDRISMVCHAVFF